MCGQPLTVGVSAFVVDEFVEPTDLTLDGVKAVFLERERVVVEPLAGA